MRFPDCDIANPFVKYVLFKCEQVKRLFALAFVIFCAIVFAFHKQADSAPSLASVLHGNDADELNGRGLGYLLRNELRSQRLSVCVVIASLLIRINKNAELLA